MTADITSTEVSGVETLFAKKEGLTTAGILFRVGRADESLATTGITHLVEHLALHDHGLGDLHYNGATADLYTHFHVEGTQEHVVEYLNGVCSALRSLPLHRLEIEKEILRTEAAGRSWGPAPHAALYRYGAVGYGLSAFEDVGLPRLDAPAVQAWAHRHFTRQNACLWIAGPAVPQGLDLTLGEGVRSPAPVVTSALPITPAWYGGDGDVVYVNGIVGRSAAATVFARVLSRALYLDLRQHGGLSYQAAADYTPRDRDHAVIEVIADCLPEKREAVIGGVVDTLARLRFGTITENEIVAATRPLLQALEAPDWAVMAVPAWAINSLVGAEIPSRQELLAELGAVTTDDVRTVAEEFHSTALAQVPALGLDWAGFERAPEKSSVRLAGKEFTSRERDGTTMVVAPEGLSFTGPDALVTVQYTNVVAMLKCADGGRILFGSDGFRIHLEPTIYPVDQASLAAIDAAVPSGSVIELPARAPEDIPRPRPNSPFSAGRNTKFDRFMRWNKVWLSCIFTIAFFAGAVSISADAAAGRHDVTASTVVVAWTLFGVFLFSAWLSVRNLRRYLRSRHV